MNDASEQFWGLYRSFERAVKDSGYTLKRRREEADWIRFAQDLGWDFFDETYASGEAAVLISQPPGERIIAGGRGTWRTRPSRSPMYSSCSPTGYVR